AVTDTGVVGSGAEEEPRVFRRGGISYLRVPAREPLRSAAFYEVVFGWAVYADRDDPSFEDGSGHVIGHFMADLPVAGEAGVLPYVFVERLAETLGGVVAHGGGGLCRRRIRRATCGLRPSATPRAM